MSLKEFIQKQQLSMQSLPIFERPDTQWGEAYHWQVKIKREGFGPVTSLVTFYSKGPGHMNRKTGQPIPPTIEEVMESLHSDQSRTSRSFKEFCDDFGYNEDSISARNTYEAIHNIGAQLVELLGHEGARQFIGEVEND